MIVERAHWRSVEGFYCDLEAWDAALLQASPVRADTVMSRIADRGVDITITEFGVGAVIRERFESDKLVIGFCLDAPPSFQFCGHTLAAGDVLVFVSGHEISYAVPPGARCCLVEISRSLADVMGWEIAAGHPGVVCAGGDAVRALGRCCWLAINAVPDGLADGHRGLAPTTFHALLSSLDAVILELCERLSEAGPAVAMRERLQLSQSAALTIEAECPHVSLRVDALARDLGVSRRTLFRAFSDVFGVTPVAYQRLFRLNALRRRLIASTAEDETVTHLAAELGFTHFGRLSGDYRHLFGEKPSETLRRPDGAVLADA